MKTTNTFGVHFLIRQDKLKEGKAPRVRSHYRKHRPYPYWFKAMD
ncbi:MAG: hypothetical protein ABI367_12555 [Mucilaginibacter sp.]